MEKYICRSCNSEFRIGVKPSVCPACGSDNIYNVSHLIARETAVQLIEELNELKPKLETAFSAYAQLYGRYEAIRITLRQYKKRGIVSEDEVPVIEKPLLREKLKEYREGRKEK